MRLSIVTGVCGALEITRQWVEETIGACTGAHELIVVSNGNSREERDLLFAICEPLTRQGWKLLAPYTEEPVGSSRAFNMGVRWATDDIVALLHNDLMLRQPGWDQELLEFFQAHPEAGVVGFHGARGLGAADIYRTPYRLVQLARWDTWSNLEDWQAHGAHATQPMPVAVLDGMGLCCRREGFLDWGGFDESLGPHHLYDIDLALAALSSGKLNYLLPIRASHISGQTANASRYNDRVRQLGYKGGDVDVHRQAHERFYCKWKGLLPISVDDPDSLQRLRGHRLDIHGHR